MKQVLQELVNSKILQQGIVARCHQCGSRIWRELGLISQIFDADTKYLDNDSVFAVKTSLIGELKPSGKSATDFELKFDFVLKPKSEKVAAAA